MRSIGLLIVLLTNGCLSQYRPPYRAQPPIDSPSALPAVFPPSPSPPPSNFIPIPVHRTASPLQYHQTYQLLPSSPPAPIPGYTSPFHFQNQFGAGYTTINTVGQPYQMYQQRVPQYQNRYPTPQQIPTSFTRPHKMVPQMTTNVNILKSNVSPTTPSTPLYGSSFNAFIGNLPPASSVYGAPLGASPPGSNGNINNASKFPFEQDTWEALEASLDTRKSRRT